MVRNKKKSFLSISIIKEGYIKFNYRKNTVKEKGKINGIFRFFINYLIEINDNADNSENEYKEVYYLLKPGRYSFLFQYLKNIEHKIHSLFVVKI